MKLRGFELVKNEARMNKQVAKNPFDKTKELTHFPEITLPVRGDARSAGYDFSVAQDMNLLPAQKVIVWTDVKAYMQEDEVLSIVPRSSLGIKKGLMLGNTVGIIDSSYYENEGNDGNIGLALLNTSGVTIQLKAGDRIAQGIFTKYLVADNDVTLNAERTGGIGSTGE